MFFWSDLESLMLQTWIFHSFSSHSQVSADHILLRQRFLIKPYSLNTLSNKPLQVLHASQGFTAFKHFLIKFLPSFQPHCFSIFRFSRFSSIGQHCLVSLSSEGAFQRILWLSQWRGNKITKISNSTRNHCPRLTGKTVKYTERKHIL